MISLPLGWRSRRSTLVLSSVARTVLGTLALLLLASVAPVLAGWESTVVLSGSMAPTVQPGDVTVVRPVSPDALRPGQILLVDDPTTPGQLRLHRLAEVTPAGLLLKGDANSSFDQQFVAPDAVHGVGVLCLPRLGMPALWAAEGRALPLAGSAVALVVLVALAFAHRTGDEPRDPPTPAAGGGRARRLRRATRATVPVTAAGLVALLATLPGVSAAGATFTASTANDADSWAVSRYLSCRSAALDLGAAQYLPLQESGGTAAANQGSFNGSGTYAGAVSYRVTGPSCGDANRAVRFDGTSGFLWTSISVNDPGTFSTQLWFNTTTRRGGYLVGFGTGTNGSSSGQRDRLVYMTDAGNVVFGVYASETLTATSPGTYNDGGWHLMTATFSGRTGLRLYVDGALVARNSNARDAEPYTGFFRVGFDSLAGWPTAPSSNYFAGSVAHVGIFASVISADDVADQYAAAG